jgi:hypothetical protein
MRKPQHLARIFPSPGTPGEGQREGLRLRHQRTTPVAKPSAPAAVRGKLDPKHLKDLPTVNRPANRAHSAIALTYSSQRTFLGTKPITDKNLSLRFIEYASDKPAFLHPPIIT